MVDSFTAGFMAILLTVLVFFLSKQTVFLLSKQTCLIKNCIFCPDRLNQIEKCTWIFVKIVTRLEFNIFIDTYVQTNVLQNRIPILIY